MDALILKVKETKIEIEERRQQIEMDSDEARYLAVQVTELEEERARLILERAEYAAKKMHIRLLLELLDEMNGKEKEEKEYPDECTDYEEFFERTRRPMSEGIIKNGKMIQFDNGMVFRYLDRIIVEDDGYVVKFKCGVEVKVKR